MENDFRHEGTEAMLSMQHTVHEGSREPDNRDRQVHIQKAGLFVKDCLLGNNFPFLDSKISIYKMYRSKSMRLLLSITVVANIALALTQVEEDSKRISKDSILVRALIMITEGWCLSVFIFQSAIQFRFMGWRGYYRNTHCVVLFTCTLIYFIDLLIIPLIFRSVPVADTVLDSSRVVLRFYVRPVYVVLHFTRLRETVPAIVRTARALIPIVLFIFNFLVIFAIYGFVMFSNRNSYFTSTMWALYQLMISLTTANFPDIMIQGYAHPYIVDKNVSGPFYNATSNQHVTQVTYSVQKNNTAPLEFTWDSLSWWATPCYFIIFHLIGIYFLLSVAFAVVYKVYKEHLQKTTFENYKYRLRMLDLAFDSLQAADQNSYKHINVIGSGQNMDSFASNGNGLNAKSEEWPSTMYLNSIGGGSTDDFNSIRGLTNNDVPGIDLKLFAQLCRELQPERLWFEDGYFDSRQSEDAFPNGATVGLIQDCVSHPKGLIGTVEHVVLNNNNWVCYVSFDDGSSNAIQHQSLQRISEDDEVEQPKQRQSPCSRSPKTDNNTESPSKQRQLSQVLLSDGMGDSLCMLTTPMLLPSDNVSTGDESHASIRIKEDTVISDDKVFTPIRDNNSDSAPSTPRVSVGDRVILLVDIIAYPKGTVGVIEEVMDTSECKFYQVNLGKHSEVRYLARHTELVHIEPPDSPVRLLRVMFYAMDGNNSGTLDALQFREIYNMLQLKVSTIQDVRLPEEKYLSKSVRENPFVKSIFVFGRSEALTMMMNFFIVASIVLMVVHFEMMKRDTELHPDGKNSNLWYLFMYLEASVSIIFCLETALKIVSMGWSGYRVKKWNRFDFYITILNIILLALFFVYACVKGFDQALLLFLHDPKVTTSHQSRPDFLIIMFLGRLLRSLRISASNASLRYILKTFSNILPLFGAYMADLLILYYYFASLGMLLFRDKVPPYGTDYSNDNYYALNFNSFWSSCVTLWCLMVVNNWYIIVDGYRACCGDWVILYFTSFWFMSVILLMNIVTALVVEVWGSQWEINKHKESDISKHPMCQRIMNIGLLTPADGEDYYKLGLPSHPSGSRPSYKVKYRNYSHRIQLAMERIFLPSMVGEMDTLSPAR
eukprot:TRINITY_DN5164_c0_g2_i1.p1 TRINITY_DN5164_c0_g2~~TRINITY_DN5164_c0_g2_i1.p1  ORF type:complete len:1111 (+),score=156.11 TRINITY_DN5164_c0_g2_i1:39-3371(+)